VDVSTASSVGGDFNFDFTVSITEEQQRQGGSSTTRRGGPMDPARILAPVAKFAASCGTDGATYVRERPGVSAFALQDGNVYHSYSAYSREWMGCGRTSGSTARPRGATRRVSGGDATTSTTERARARLIAGARRVRCGS
jgi:predicted dithiol-disulfide oxidoreductase (DUF899 family)